jgi:hypothetical protein
MDQSSADSIRLAEISKPMMLAINSLSERRTEPVSATPSGGLTTVTSMAAVSAQFEKSDGEHVPLNSGTSGQIFFASGSRGQ